MVFKRVGQIDRHQDVTHLDHKPAHVGGFGNWKSVRFTMLTVFFSPRPLGSSFLETKLKVITFPVDRIGTYFNLYALTESGKLDSELSFSDLVPSL